VSIVQIVMMDVDKIRFAPFNPPTRLSKHALGALMADIKVNGVELPVVVRMNGELIDGHRRVACARALGIKQVPVIVKDSAGLYTRLNKGRKPVGGSEWLYVYMHGGEVPEEDVLPHIKQIERLVGQAGLRELSELGCSHEIITETRRLSKYCYDAHIDEFMAQAMMWMARKKMQMAVRIAQQEGAPPDEIITAIDSDVILVNVWKANK
jgi:hypothetical protein